MQKITDIAANTVSYPNYCHTQHLHITHFLTFHVPSFLLMSQEGGTSRGVRQVFIARDLIFCTLHYFLWQCDQTRVMTSSFLRFLDHTRRTTVGRTPLDEWSARRRDLYPTTHITHNRQTSMPPPGGIRTHDLSRRAAADRRLSPRGHWDRPGICHTGSNLFYFGTTFYMFRTVSPFIIRSLRLYIQHQVYVTQVQIYFILEQHSTCFGLSLRPSPGV